MDFIPYLGFSGNCREAFEFYAGLFGGTIEAMVTHADMPQADQEAYEAKSDKIMHGSLRVGDGLLYGGDAPDNYYQTPAGFMVTVNIPEAAEGERIFNALAEGGQVQMPYGETFWAERFGMVIDRFGTPWAINGGPSRS
jgi:PhnB protein